MAEIKVTTRHGDVRTLDAAAGRSVMQIIRDGGLGELLALCGGCLSCATCHIYVAADWTSRLPPVSEDEEAMLDEVEARTELSRLSCQISFKLDLEGLAVTIAPGN